MKKQVCIVHFNTPGLTEACVKSILKHTPDCSITIFDNSDKAPFHPMDGVRIIDNTKGQEIDFVKMLEKYPDKTPTSNDWGSAKHCASIQKLWEYYSDGFVLMDSDVIVKRDFSDLFDESVAFVGEEFCNPSVQMRMVPRLWPFICWINVPMCMESGVHYYDDIRNWKLGKDGWSAWYDTGASFLEDCKKAKLPYRNIKISDYIDHFGGASHWVSPWYVWLEERKQYFEDMKENKKSDSKDKILVVIPFCSEGAQGRELEYSVAGWRKHFKENYLIVIAGEDHPVTKTGDDIICIKSERVPPKEGMYRQHLDYVSCFKKVHKAFPESKGFIFVADDVYAVNDFDMTDIMFLKERSSKIDDYPDDMTGWKRDKKRTKEVLLREGYPIRNFTTHLPQWFEWDKLERLWEKYDMENNSYVFEDLYYNIYYPNKIPFTLNIDHDNLKCGVYRPYPRLHYIDNAFKSKIWIQNSAEGWIPYLDDALAKYYGFDK